jgi:hypothetical protein
MNTWKANVDLCGENLYKTKNWNQEMKKLWITYDIQSIPDRI